MDAKTSAILYSFRRCPYAMRARLAIAYSQVEVEIREVILKDKPKFDKTLFIQSTFFFIICYASLIDVFYNQFNIHYIYKTFYIYTD